jgi:ABC-type lipoprotein export system ATPase subunit
VVTHDAHLASWADRVIFIRDGRAAEHAVADLPDTSPAAPRA